jgi:hypothetical protein
MMKIYSSTSDSSIVIIVLGKTEESCKKVAARYFANNNIKGAPVAIDLVKSTYFIEEDATVISFNGRGL